MALTLASRIVSDVVILDMTGRLSVLEPVLRDTVKKHLEDGSRAFVLNLTDVTYVNSAGFSQMVAAWTSIQNAGGQMTLLRPCGHVRRLLEITRLVTVFRIFEEESQAIDAARSVVSGLSSSLRPELNSHWGIETISSAGRF